MQITHAKLLAAAAIMHLAACEHAADVSQHSTSSCIGPRDISLQDKQILLSEGDVQPVNPHPPFRGVFRDALLNSGLLNDLIDLAMHIPDNFATGNHAQHAQVHGGFQHTAVLQKQVMMTEAPSWLLFCGTNLKYPWYGLHLLTMFTQHVMHSLRCATVWLLCRWFSSTR